MFRLKRKKRCDCLLKKCVLESEWSKIVQKDKILEKEKQTHCGGPSSKKCQAVAKDWNRKECKVSTEKFSCIRTEERKFYLGSLLNLAR